VFLDVADLSESLVVPEPSLDLPFAGDVSQLLYNQCLEDAEWSSRWLSWAGLVVGLGEDLFYVVQVEH
jgi:hypothetical protein